MIHKHYLFLYSYFLSFYLMSCNYNHIKTTDDSKSPTSAQIQSALSSDFSSIYNSVLATECLTCHSSAAGSKGGLNLETYEQVRSQIEKIYYRSIEKKDMPAGGLGIEKLTLLKNWIDQGAPLKSTGQSNQIISRPIDWLTIKKKVLGASCLDCHSGEAASAGVDLSQYDIVKTNINTIFETVFINKKMPLQPYPNLTESQKMALLKWISQGMNQ